MSAGSSLAHWLQRPPYQAYSYAYPHKSAYRRLVPAVELAPVWAREARDALFLYLHVPFCSYRCGFCNLFALARPAGDLVDAFVEQMIAQLRVTTALLGEHRFARFAIGGGTPTFLSAAQLARVFEAVQHHAGIAPGSIPSGIEVSPETVDDERMAVVRAGGIERVSMGIQSFSDSEVRRLVRPQQREVVDRAIATIRRHGFPVLNLDLIYGIAGQSAASFLASIESALAYRPEEIYLYPLYVREQTGLAKIQSRERDATVVAAPGDDARAALYAHGRDRLLAAGYTQVSMRMFRAAHAPDSGGPTYCCQNDGMVGIGCGARSYTRDLHYASEYAVQRGGVADIIRAYVARAPSAFAFAEHGFRLDADEQRRRYAMQSLLVWPGLDQADYRQRFGSEVMADLPQLHELLALALARDEHGLLALTDQGMARADTIGPWLNSAQVAAAMAGGDHD